MSSTAPVQQPPAPDHAVAISTTPTLPTKPTGTTSSDQVNAGLALFEPRCQSCALLTQAGLIDAVHDAAVNGHSAMALTLWINPILEARGQPTIPRRNLSRHLERHLPETARLRQIITRAATIAAPIGQDELLRRLARMTTDLQRADTSQAVETVRLALDLVSDLVEAAGTAAYQDLAHGRRLSKDDVSTLAPLVRETRECAVALDRLVLSKGKMAAITNVALTALGGGMETRFVEALDTIAATIKQAPIPEHERERLMRAVREEVRATQGDIRRRGDEVQGACRTLLRA